MDFGELQRVMEVFSYPAVLGLLLACGLGAPLSEDAILIAAGLVTAHAHGSLPWMMLVAWVGVVAGDSLLWRVGRTFGTRAVRLRSLRRVLTEKRVAWAQRHFDRYGVFTIFLARFLIGFRAVTFLCAGTTGMPYRRFVLADALGAAIFVPALVYLGWRFGQAVLDDVKSTLAWILAGAVVAVLAVATVSAVRRRSQLHASRLPEESKGSA